MMHRERAFAAWALATLLVAPLAKAADTVDIRAVAGLPRTGFVNGQATLWHNVGIIVESDWLDAEVNFATCLPATHASPTPLDRSTSACASSTEALATGNLGHGFALTYKVPRWSEAAPFVDLSLRSWRAPPRVVTPGLRSDGTVAEFVVTQPLGTIDAFFGYSTPVLLPQATSGWLSAFAGVTWYAGRNTRLDLVADRGVETSTATRDRTITLRLAHATAANEARVATWTTRSLDARSNAWQFGAEFDIKF